MPDYQNRKIYKLWSPQGKEDEIYIGSTCDELYKRKSAHKCLKDCQSKILFQKYTDVRIEVIEEYPCNNKQELQKKEGEYIRNNKCLNKNIPDRTKQEYRENNKEKIIERRREYNEQNKEKIAEYNKEYNENNKEAIAEKSKEYYQNNSVAIAERRKEKVTCECGCIIRKSDLARHKQTNKHINALI